MTYWKLSSKWLVRRHDCTLEGILGRCKANCCRVRSFWPCRVLPQADGSCAYLTPYGCAFDLSQRPVVCLLYPLTVNRHNTVVLHNRTVFKTGVCKGAHNNGPELVLALRACLVKLFGHPEYLAARDKLLAGKDAWVKVPPQIYGAWLREEEMMVCNELPQGRSLYYAEDMTRAKNNQPLRTSQMPLPI